MLRAIPWLWLDRLISTSAPIPLGDSLCRACPLRHRTAAEWLISRSPFIHLNTAGIQANKVHTTSMFTNFGHLGPDFKNRDRGTHRLNRERIVGHLFPPGSKNSRSYRIDSRRTKASRGHSRLIRAPNQDNQNSARRSLSPG